MLTRYTDSIIPFNPYDIMSILSDTTTSDFLHRDVKQLSYSITKDDMSLTLSVDVPGVKQEDIDVSIVDSHHIQVSGKRGEKKFADKFRIDRIYDVSTADVTLENGVLDIKMFKSPEKQPKKLLVKLR